MPEAQSLPNLALLVAHYRDLFGLRDWEIAARWGEPEEMGSALARIVPLPERRIADLVVSKACPPEELRATVAHEVAHALVSPLANIGEWSAGALMLEEQIVEALAQAVTRAERMPSDAPVMRRALSDLPARIRARLATSRAPRRREGNCSMDPLLLIAALSAIIASGDPGAGLAEFVSQLQGMVPADAPQPSAADLEGGPVEMMRRMLARSRVAPGLLADALGPRVLARLGVKSEPEAMMRLETLLAASTERDAFAAADDTRNRRALAVETMTKAGLARSAFFVDGSDELIEVWRAGTLEDMRRALAPIARAGAPVVRPKAAPDVSGEAGLRERAERSGMSVEMRRKAEENVNRGAAAVKE